MGAWSVLASSPAAWKAALVGGKLLDFVPEKLIPVPAFHAWAATRTLPGWRGGEFRRWLKERKKP
jgi:L-lactate dehydrogenase complex protein LldF